MSAGNANAMLRKHASNFCNHTGAIRHIKAHVIRRLGVLDWQQSTLRGPWQKSAVSLIVTQ